MTAISIPDRRLPDPATVVIRLARHWPDDAAPHPVRAGADVHVWKILLDAVDPRGAETSECLSTEEVERAHRFRFDVDRRRFVACHVALRAILGAYAGTEASELVFSRGPNGRPFLDPSRHGPRLRFNVSHSHDVALVAVSDDGEVGVDLERLRPLADLDAVVARYFSTSERIAFTALPTEHRLRAFFRVWTAKEAYLKACGDGLSRLDQFDVAVGVDQDVRLLAVRDRPGDERRWSLEAVDAGDAYVVTLALERAGLVVRLGTSPRTVRRP